MRDICSASRGSVASSTSSSASWAIFNTSSRVTLMRSPSPARGPRTRGSAVWYRSPGRRRRPGDRYQTAARRVRGPRAGLGERMSVTRDDVLKIAQLAELDVDEATLPLLAEQMSRILDYVAQIGAVAASEGAR